MWLPASRGGCCACGLAKPVPRPLLVWEGMRLPVTPRGWPIDLRLLKGWRPCNTLPVCSAAVFKRKTGIAVLSEQGDHLRQGGIQFGFQRVRRVDDEHAAGWQPRTHDVALGIDG